MTGSAARRLSVPDHPAWEASRFRFRDRISDCCYVICEPEQRGNQRTDSAIDAEPPGREEEHPPMLYDFCEPSSKARALFRNAICESP